MSIRRLAAFTILALLGSALAGYFFLAGAIGNTYFMIGGVGYFAAIVTVVSWGFFEQKNEHRSWISGIAWLAVLLAVVWLVVSFFV